MKYNQLGESDLHVSEICLGTMTFGNQNTIAEAHQQLDYAIAQGVNFIDAAEMYPVPPQESTQGLTETYIGEWLVRQERDKLIIATKIAGPGRNFKWLRDGKQPVDRKNIEQAVNDSLKRLQTDYIDLYQIHWPDRNVPRFGETIYDPNKERETVAIAEQLTVFADLIQAGKIRYVGLSNETPWGVSEFSHIAKQLSLPKVVSIQNAYNLINRLFDSALAETCWRENVGLLAYSPLGFGFLTGKYLNGVPAKSRLSLFQGFGGRYGKPNVEPAVAAYVEIARAHNLKPSALALAFVRSRWFVASTIIGATTLEQLSENLESVNVSLSPQILEEIDAVNTRYPSPAP
ncbi:NADP(H)-dependent aldo-keto reductase [Aetokthonos hydrillicola Thurmond2011]|jgi:aryl-alcohol dehydrogenase (NADP+)|uniref:Protein tas n=1 Tax=Aetokthonos hydrillicola Thurmond2011 TaxID=2712845 RepID=A0AAP5MA19_9CYAN|nr:NADP(H)-dependent aldo-keto reductase [Aetokthonos hydrillicola]MBO3463806.1 NADP(H)-dependent aldo-keto reductase [Aetokthonos hydrillicola CCALA 1050]MBW4584806.1 NADP(H)-dependent aldo-keto reductase [Aetokthonos hydrillicola CCALA 1050]MDR9895353.1 NADP(H)-dependent aldo-keto reductase [Aetokthonos hydrillicola Thurmond2011]